MSIKININGVDFTLLFHGEWSNRSLRSPSKKVGAWLGEIIHWPGAVKGVDDLEVEGLKDEVEWLQSIEAYHLSKKNKDGSWTYNGIAYNWAVGRFNRVYELRGAKYDSGAHSPKNRTHEAVLFLYSTNEQVPNQMWETFKAFRYWRRQNGVGDELLDHSQTSSTSCAGDPVRQLLSGQGGGTYVPKPSAPGNSSSGILQQGSRGEAVANLQSSLNRFGANLIVDGDFGSKTKQAVIDFQTSRGIAVDGIVGPQTLSELSKASSAVPKSSYSGRVSKRGSKGKQVETIQAGLNRNGANLKVDGVYGPRTESAVRQFQLNKGLKVDGITGPVTWKVLIG